MGNNCFKAHDVLHDGYGSCTTLEEGDARSGQCGPAKHNDVGQQCSATYTLSATSDGGALGNCGTIHDGGVIAPQQPLESGGWDDSRKAEPERVCMMEPARAARSSPAGTATAQSTPLPMLQQGHAMLPPGLSGISHGGMMLPLSVPTGGTPDSCLSQPTDSRAAQQQHCQIARACIAEDSSAENAGSCSTATNSTATVTEDAGSAPLQSPQEPCRNPSQPMPYTVLQHAPAQGQHSTGTSTAGAGTEGAAASSAARPKDGQTVPTSTPALASTASTAIHIRLSLAALGQPAAKLTPERVQAAAARHASHGSHSATATATSTHSRLMRRLTQQGRKPSSAPSLPPDPGSNPAATSTGPSVLRVTQTDTGSSPAASTPSGGTAGAGGGAVMETVAGSLFGGGGEGEGYGANVALDSLWVRSIDAALLDTSRVDTAGNSPLSTHNVIQLLGTHGSATNAPAAPAAPGTTGDGVAAVVGEVQEQEQGGQGPHGAGASGAMQVSRAEETLGGRTRADHQPRDWWDDGSAHGGEFSLVLGRARASAAQHHPQGASALQQAISAPQVASSALARSPATTAPLPTLALPRLMIQSRGSRCSSQAAGSNIRLSACPSVVLLGTGDEAAGGRVDTALAISNLFATAHMQQAQTANARVQQTALTASERVQHLGLGLAGAGVGAAAAAAAAAGAGGAHSGDRPDFPEMMMSNISCLSTSLFDTNLSDLCGEGGQE